MPDRILWNGTVTFGLVAFPANMVPATRERLAFHLLHDEDNAALRRVMFCPAHNKTIHPEHIVRGYEIQPEKYVIVREDELESLEPKRSHTIEISEFVDAAAIDPMYYSRTYYLVPDGVDKPYYLLVATLAETKRLGIASFIMHDREYLVAVQSLAGALCLSTLRYASEILSAEDIVPKGAKVDAAGLRMAEKTIKEMTGPFKPEKFTDEHRERVMKYLHSKKPKTIAAPAGEGQEGEEPPEPVDLIAALEASLAKARHKEGGQARKKSK